MAREREICDRATRWGPPMRGIVTSGGTLVCNGRSFRASLGYGGVRSDKREGDGATPAGVLPLRKIMYRGDREIAPDCAVPLRAIAPHDGWCDDQFHPSYNRMVRLPIIARAEPLWREDRLYDI